jgi:hypothetical protein
MFCTFTLALSVVCAVPNMAVFFFWQLLNFVFFGYVLKLFQLLLLLLLFPET